MFDVKIYLNALSYSRHLQTELLQAEEEGKDIKKFIRRVEDILALPEDDPQKEYKAAEIYDEISALPVRDNYRYVEPSDLKDIIAVRPKKAKQLHKSVNHDELYDKVYGAWLGRCAGCLAGCPIEGWHKERLYGFLRETGNFPFSNYISDDVSEKLVKKYDVNQEEWMPWINHVNQYVKGMPGDDDTNHTVFVLKLFETCGTDFTPLDIANLWQGIFPVHKVATAEKVAYRNFVNGILPPKSANYRNPYREWIGAQIRADFFGYVNPGNPEMAAEMAWRDASISHVKNGIYGEMFVAAMLAAAAITNDIDEIIQCGLSVIPENSRLAETIYWVLDFQRKGLTWEQAVEEIHTKFDEKSEHDWCHVISNAAIVCLSLLYGEKDYEKSISIAIMCAFDTDCNGATVGSIIGMLSGAKALPPKWTEPLHDTLNSCIIDYNKIRISDLASRTVDIIKKNRD